MNKKEIDNIQKDVTIFGPIPDQIKKLLGLKQQNGKISLIENGPEPVVEIWGSGQARREFLHVDDLASACLFVMGLEDHVFKNINLPTENKTPYSQPSFINIGTGKDITIESVAKIIQKIKIRSYNESIRNKS